MKRLCWLWLLLLASVPTVSLAGDIQVACEPGLRVFLDGRFAGTSTSKDDGLFLAGVPSGKHTIRVEKEGFASQSFRVVVLDVPIEVSVLEFSPKAGRSPEQGADNAEVRQAPGGLRVVSAPQDCVVEIDGKPEVKNTPLLRISGLTPGEHPISFSKPGYERISGVVRIISGIETTVRGDLKSGEVKTVYEGKGSLRLISTPDHCAVQFLGKVREKTRAVLTLSCVPAGEHRIVVEWDGRRVSSNIVIAKDQRTIVVVNLLKRGPEFSVSYRPE